MSVPDSPGKNYPAGATSLTIPNISESATAVEAAHLYAAAGMFIIPTDPKKIKNPGSIVGNNWQDKSSRDPEQIEEWFANYPDRGIAWHVGRSGAIAFDLDRDEKPEDVDGEIWDALQTGAIHATRETGPRAHYVFRCEPDEFGNSAGAFQPFGQVRCKNGVVILAPTPHPDADTKGGRYYWRRPGEVPPLPDTLRAELKKAAEAIEPKTSEELKEFLNRYVQYDSPQGLQGLLVKFRTSVEKGSGRHDAMRDVLWWGFAEAIIGRFPARDVYGSLKLAFYNAKPEARGTTEFDELAKWAAKRAELDDPDETRRKVNRSLYADPLDAIQSDLNDFWASSRQLQDLRQFAQARLVGPAAMLGSTLARVTAHIPPNVVLPPIVGGHASLNLFVALVGRSGESKSASMRASSDWLNIEPDYPPSKPGSGEGLAKCFAYTSKVGGATTQIGKQWSVLAQLPEIDTLNAAGNRGGATILSTLREGWSGERIGFDYAGADKRIVLRENRYRLCLVMGVQPERAAWLLADADGGTPQRFVWLPVSDPDTPDVEPPEPPRLSLGRWRDFSHGGVVDPDTTRASLLDAAPDPADYVVLTLPAVAVERVRATQRAIRRCAADVDPLDGHKLLCQLKVAAALMALEDRQHEITEFDWQRASVVMAVSDLTRKDVVNKIHARAENENRNRGRADAHREIVKAQVIAEETSLVKTMADRIAKKLQDEDGQVLSNVRKALSAKSTRERFDTAVRHLIEHGTVKSEDFTTPNGRESTRLWLI